MTIIHSFNRKLITGMTVIKINTNNFFIITHKHRTSVGKMGRG